LGEKDSKEIRKLDKKLDKELEKKRQELIKAEKEAKYKKKKPKSNFFR